MLHNVYTNPKWAFGGERRVTCVYHTKDHEVIKPKVIFVQNVIVQFNITYISVFLKFCGNTTDLVKYPHGQHRKGRVDDVVKSDEVLIIHGLQKGGGGHTDY